MLDIDKPGKTIPQSFMGFSHEWPYVEELYTIPQYMDIIKLLQSFGSGGCSSSSSSSSSSNDSSSNRPLCA
jgi:hypothetical protein